MGYGTMWLGRKPNYKRLELSFKTFKKQVCERDDTLFWIDTWCGNEPLKNKFPDLYQL